MIVGIPLNFLRIKGRPASGIKSCWCKGGGEETTEPCLKPAAGKTSASVARKGASWTVGAPSGLPSTTCMVVSTSLWSFACLLWYHEPDLSSGSLGSSGKELVLK